MAPSAAVARTSGTRQSSAEVAIAASAAGSSFTPVSVARNPLVVLAYVALLATSTLHLYRKPAYDMDSVQYMGNALLMQTRDVAEIHRRVYEALNRDVPSAALAPLLGHDAGAPEDQNKSRQERAASPEHLAEFLPMFAIRPLYNQTLYVMSRTGVGLVRGSVLVSVGSYFLIGIVVFVWIGKYAHARFAAAVALLLMISPPIMSLGRGMTSDALATLVAFTSLYLIFERGRLVAGLIVLLASIYFRTDFVVLAVPAVFACALQRRLDPWKAAILAGVALLSVLSINHFAGDYGLEMLYYRNFVGTPIAPGEMTAHFSLADYLSAFRSGITKMGESFFFPFLLVGTIGLLQKRAMILFAVTLAYVFLHFVVLPNWQERWVGLFYLCAVVCAVMTIQQAKNGELRAAAPLVLLRQQ